MYAQLTREQFLAGVRFHHRVNKYRVYELTRNHPTDSQAGHLSEYNGINPLTAPRKYHCNVDKVTKKRFRCYLVVAGSTTYAWRNFEDMVIIDEPKPVIDGN